MSLTPGTSRVVISLDLVGQREAVAGLRETTTALEDMGTAVKGVDDAVAASTERMAGVSTAAYGDMAKGAADAADEIGVANEKVVATSEEAAAAMVSSSDETIAAMDRTQVAAERSLGTGKVGGTGLVDMLTSMKALVVGGLAYESVKMFSGYQTALTKLGTIAGLTSGQLKEVNRQIMASAVALRTSPTALAGAYYNPISEGFGLKASSYVVAMAAKEANMTGAPLDGQGGTAYALSTLLQTYGHKHPSRAQAMNMAAMLHGALTTGDMSMSQLLAANSTGFFNNAQQYGVGFKSAASILDFFSSQGVSPRKAGTRMNETLALMTAPTTMGDRYWTQLGLTTADAQGVQGQLSALGLTTTKLSYMMHSGPNGFMQALGAIGAATRSMNPETRSALYDKLFGGGRTGTAMMTLLNHPGTLSEFYGRINANSSVSKFNSAYGEYTHTFQANLHKLGAQFDVAAIAVGKRLVPAFDMLVSVLSPIFKFASGPIGSALVGLALGGVAVMGVAKILGKMGGWLADTGPGHWLEGKILGGLLPSTARTDGALGHLSLAARAAADALEKVAGAGDTSAGTGAGAGAGAGAAEGAGVGAGTAIAAGVAAPVLLFGPLAYASYREQQALKHMGIRVVQPKTAGTARGGLAPFLENQAGQQFTHQQIDWLAKNHLNANNAGVAAYLGHHDDPTAKVIRIHNHLYIDGKEVTASVKKHLAHKVARQ